MSNADAQIKTILDKFGESFADNTWPVPGGKARAILHKCIERMAAKAGIRFDLPQIVDASPDNVVIIVSGNMAGQEPVWSFGEASPKNNKNAYSYSMAEKRGKDRVALKLLNLHGLLYSEEEAEDFKRPAEAKEAPAAAVPTTRIPTTRLPTTKTEPGFVGPTLVAALNLSNSIAELSQWHTDNKAAIDALSADEQAVVREAYRAKLNSLKLVRAA